MLTIGAFARASRLSPKALRLYDGLDLLRPARVDPDTGYRYYAAGQLERARLVAWLRRLGMPLARIREVCGLEAPAAAREIRAYWTRVERETAERRDLAGFLVDHLSQRAGRRDKDDIAMTTSTLTLRYAAHSDRGRVRPVNQDTAYAGNRLLAVADGYGPAGGPASTAAVETLKALEGAEGRGEAEVSAGEVLNLLEAAVLDAALAVEEATAGAGAARAEDAGTTLTALLLTGSHLALVHIGDSRAYLLRDGGLFRVTHDHTVVQAMIDEGRLTPEEAVTHPQRTLLLNSLTGTGRPAPDLRLHTARPGDRYLLCSDGLPAVVPDAALRTALTAAPSPEDAVTALIAAANEAGGPDNISCVVADVHHDHDGHDGHHGRDDGDDRDDRGTAAA
ncbi:MerR family transcriptional regulator [Streptomyces sp. NPDC093252]|uniref:protein phosphatase 2C domain-containing protein n=1 Tax=Streptomyces sp. NPDC093252 TaxID=3154980 RepID=UPI0034490BFF